MGSRSLPTPMSMRGAPAEICARITWRRISWCQPRALIAHPYDGRDRPSRTAIVALTALSAEDLFVREAGQPLFRRRSVIVRRAIDDRI